MTALLFLLDIALTSQVGLDWRRLLVGGSLCLCLTELLDQAHWLPLETPLETPADTGVDDLHELLVGHVQEGIQLDSTVGELSEGSGPLLLGGGSGVVVIHCRVTKRDGQ